LWTLVLRVGGPIQTKFGVIIESPKTLDKFVSHI